MNIVNLTQHNATAEQIAEGVFEPDCKQAVKDLLTFNDIPTEGELEARAKMLVYFAQEQAADAAMIGGAPYLMHPLEVKLKEAGIQPLYSFTARESVESVDVDGNVIKTAVFRHKGFVRV